MGTSEKIVTMHSAARKVRFGAFAFDRAAGELRKHGIKLRVTGQPIQILEMLLARPGDVVTREEIQAKLWPADTFVDFDHSLNAAVNKLRDALGDSAEEPKYIETLPRRGYRWIGTIEGTASSAGAGTTIGDEQVNAESVECAVSAGGETADGRSLLVRIWQCRVRRNIALGVIAVVTVAVVAIWMTPEGTFGKWFLPTGKPEIQSIAVLPFKNLSNDPEQEYFADGLTEALISHLAQVRALRVTSRTSAMYYKGRQATLKEIAGALNVDGVIEGSVLRDAGRARISVQIVNAKTDQPVWSQYYDRDLRDLLSLQSELSREIAQQVRAQLSPDEQRRLAMQRPIDPEALQSYLWGRFFLNKRIGWATPKAIESFEAALRKDTDYAMAHASLAEALIYYWPPSETMPRAKEEAARAVAIAPGMAEVHVAQGMVRMFWEWDWKGAEQSFLRALEQNPSLSDAHSRYAHLLIAQGRFDDAIAHERTALALDPLSPEHNHVLGRFYYFARQNEKAIAQLETAIRLDPNNYWAHFFLSVVMESEKRYPEAVREFQRAMAISGAPPEAVAEVGDIFEKQGYEGLMRRRAEIELRRTQQPVIASNLALLYARLGEKEKAFEWLEKSFESHTRDLIYLKVEPQYDSLRTDPRFAKYVRRLKLGD